MVMDSKTIPLPVASFAAYGAVVAAACASRLKKSRLAETPEAVNEPGMHRNPAWQAPVHVVWESLLVAALENLPAGQSVLAPAPSRIKHMLGR